MKLAIVIYSTEPEVVWNAFRLAIYSRKQQDEVSIFLLAKGVEVPNISDKKYNIVEQIDEFIAGGGEILSCTTCVKSRNMQSNELCPLATLQDLYELIKSCDKVLTF